MTLAAQGGNGAGWVGNLDVLPAAGGAGDLSRSALSPTLFAAGGGTGAGDHEHAYETRDEKNAPFSTPKFDSSSQGEGW